MTFSWLWTTTHLIYDIHGTCFLALKSAGRAKGETLWLAMYRLLDVPETRSRASYSYCRHLKTGQCECDCIELWLFQNLIMMKFLIPSVSFVGTQRSSYTIWPSPVIWKQGTGAVVFPGLRLLDKWSNDFCQLCIFTSEWQLWLWGQTKHPGKAPCLWIWPGGSAKLLKSGSSSSSSFFFFGTGDQAKDLVLGRLVIRPLS